MAINFNSFTTGTVGGANPIQSDDFVVGFDTAVPSGERKWPITTLANAISGVMNDELINKINQNSGDGTVTSVTGTAPISVATGTTTPAISIAAATTSAAGSMSSTDKTRLDDASATNGIVKCNGSGDFSAAVAGTDYLTSATLGSSPAAAKAWACFTARNGGTDGNVFVYDDYGISAINRIATGRFEIVFSTPMPNRAYSVICQYAENVVGGFSGGGSVAVADGNGNVDFPTTDPSPDFTSSTNSGKTTDKVKVGYGTSSASTNPTEAYIHVFSS